MWEICAAAEKGGRRRPPLLPTMSTLADIKVFCGRCTYLTAGSSHPELAQLICRR